MTSHSNSSNKLSNTSSTMTENHAKRRKASSDRHRKVDGRDRRIRLPYSCAETVFALQGMFGHKNAGDTVDWIVELAKPWIRVALNTGRTNAAAANVFQPFANGLMNNPHQMPIHPPMPPASGPVPMMFPNASNGLILPAQNVAGYGTTGGTPVGMPKWPPLGFQNGMQISQGTWPRFPYNV